MPVRRIVSASATALALLLSSSTAPWLRVVAPASAQSAPATSAVQPAPAGPGAQATPDGAGAQSAPADSAAAPAPAGFPERPRFAGYLGEQRLPDHKLFLPPPPAAGSALAAADVAVFHDTRKLEGSPRWQLAANDDGVGQKALLEDFSCALGLDVAAAETPALSRVLARSGADLFPVVGAAKDLYQRPRPFLAEQGPLCIMPSEQLAQSGSYPSGHAAAGWLYALLLTEVDPAHAGRIIERGRAFGESRVVCGVHYPSDIEGGRLTATALVAALHGAPEFETDVAAARAELTTLRGSGGVEPVAAACASESATLATPW